MDQPSDNPFQSPRDDEFTIDPGRRAAAGGSELEALDWVLAAFCSGIACIVGVVWLLQGKPKGLKMIGISFLFSFLWSLIRVALVALSNQR